MSRSIGAAIALALFVLSPAAVPSAAPPNQDTIIRIGTLGGLYSILLAVNNNNAAVGWSFTATNPDWEHAILWQDGHLIDLGTLPGDVLSRALGINDRGQIVGLSLSSNLLPFRARAVIWDHGQATELPGSEVCLGMAINNRGHAAGRCEDQPWLWRDGERVGLGLLPGYDYGDVAAINDTDVVVGTMYDSRGNSTAFRWADGVLTDLGALTGTTGSQATAINARGEIAGHVNLPAPEPVVWERNTVTPLAGSWGAFHGIAVGNNNRGQVIGSGFVWWRGAFASLNPTFFASDVNERGTAVGFYSNNDGGMEGALMPKVPMP
jgi:probable HAF family extracellular repeat protein